MNKKQIAEISLELDRRRALVLDKYPTPIVLDKAKALSTSAEKTKMGQPKVTAFYLTRAGIDEGFFTPQRDVTAADMVEPGVWYGDKLSAMMAQRNRLMLTAADRLIVLDGLIDETRASAQMVLHPGTVSTEARAVLNDYVESGQDLGKTNDTEVSGLVGEDVKWGDIAEKMGVNEADRVDDFMPEVPEYKAAQAEQAAEVEAAVAEKHPAAKRNRSKKAAAEETV